LLPPLIPRAVALARGAKAAHDHGIQLESAMKDLARLYERSKEVEEAKTRFFANVSHELRTPLALILAPVERMLQQPSLTPEERFDLELVAKNARLLRKQVDDLLDVARMESGRLAADYARLDLARLVRSAAEGFAGLAQERNTKLVVEVPEALEAQLDEDKIHRVLLNLLSNAFRATPPGGVVRVTLTRPSDTHALIVVADSGPGIAPELRTLVFERFRQLEGGPTGGSGLGLAIVRDFVELHGGSVVVEGAPEGGAALRVDLPLAAPAGTTVVTDAGVKHVERREARERAEQAAVEALTPTPAPALEHVDAGARARVLVVEDEVDMGELVRVVLHGEHHVVVARDGAHALALVDEMKEPPDLVITDLMMPRVDGADLVRALRARPSLDHTPVLMLTARTDEDVRVDLLRFGAQDYVVKPFSTEELRVRAKNLVATKRAGDVLRRELAESSADLASLAATLAATLADRKREAEAALAS
jgi:CheY-like chemotaxis protein